MTRGTRALLLTLGLGLVALPGCGFRNGEGLLARKRARAAMPDCTTPSLDAGFGVPTAMPCAMPGGMPCPCNTMNGTPIYGAPEFMPGTTMPPLATPPGAAPLPLPSGNGTQPGPPGSAAPRPAEPSDPTSLRKGNGLATAKPASMP